MNTSQYEAFLKTVELGSLTKAAEMLGYTQSGITHMLNALESECNLKLLLRDRSGVRLTSEGQMLMPYFQSACSLQHGISEKINEIHRLEAGLIRIGTFTSVSAQWLPGMIKSFRADFPDIQFELLHGTNKDNEEWVMNGRVDCAFIIYPSDRQLNAIFLRRDPIVAILPDNHVLADKPFISFSELSKLPYIKMDEGVEDEITDLFKEHGIKPNIHFAEKDDYAIIAMVENGLGISVLPELVLKGSSRKIIIKELEKPAYRNLGIAVKNINMLSCSAKKFLDYVQLWISMEYGSI